MEQGDQILLKRKIFFNYKKLFSLFVLLFISGCGYSYETTDACNSSELKLLISNGKYANFVSQKCDSTENGNSVYLNNYLIINKLKLKVSTIDSEMNSDPKLEAVSVYRREGKPSLLITIHSWYYCCSPRADGTSYKVDIYQINNNSITNYNDKLHFSGEGFKGIDFDGYRKNYSFDTIQKIKIWLDKKYK